MMKKFFVFAVIWTGVFLPDYSVGGTVVIKDFPRYEFLKYNFSYLNSNSLNTLADPSRPPVYALGFLDQEISDRYSEDVLVHWDEGISGRASRFFGKGSQLPLRNWARHFSENRLSAFTVSFYFFPETEVREESLLEGEGIITLGEIQPAFRVLLRKGRVKWELQDFFRLGRNKFSKQLTSRFPFRIGEWNHVVVGYDVKNARLTMFLNGELADFTYATTDGKKSGNKYAAGFPSQGAGMASSNPVHDRPWFLGKGFTGRIDELELFDDYLPIPSRFDTQGKNPYPYHSVYVSQVFRIDKNARIRSVDILGNGLERQYTYLYLCQDKEFFPEHIRFNDCGRIPWGKQLVDYPPGEFYQLFLVYNNRDHAMRTFNEIRLNYQENDPPLPPQWIGLEQTRDGIHLEWKRTLEEISGYRIYFRAETFKGEKGMVELRENELEAYMTRDESWNYVLEGLEKDTWYFFGIKSYRQTDGTVRESEYSPIKSIYYSSDFFN